MSNNFLQDIENITSSIIPDFSGLSWFVQYLTSRGEDPIAFISTLVLRIGGRASAVAVMTEFVAGVMAYGGIEGFAEIQAQKIIQPLINTLHIYSNTGNQLATLHQHTTTTVQTKLQALTTRDTASAVPLQGDISNAMLTSLSNVTTRLNTISSALGSPQDQINQDFVNSIGTYLKGVAVIDLAILSVEAIVSLGIITIPFELVLDGSVLLVELLGLIGVVVVEGGIWLYRSMTLHAQHPVGSTNGSQVIIYHAGDLPKNNVVNTTNKNKRRYIPPQSSGGHVTRAPHGEGFIDNKGNVWEWAQDPHGGPHWDVQHPKSKKHTNVAPDGTVIGTDNFPNNDSVVPPQTQPKK